MLIDLRFNIAMKNVPRPIEFDDLAIKHVHFLWLGYKYIFK